MAESKVTLAQLRAAATKAGLRGLEERSSPLEADYWRVFVTVSSNAVIQVNAASKQKARKLMLRVLKGMTT